MTAVRREAMELADTRLLLNRLRVAAHTDGANPKSFALLLRKTFQERAWIAEGFPSFRAFIEAPEPVGLGMTTSKLLDAARLADVESLARKLLFEEDPAAAEKGGDRRSLEFQKRTTLLKPPQSETAERTVRRLKNSDPELADKVIRGEVSAYAASRTKGWKPPRVQITTPERVNKALRKWMPREALTRLAELLSEPEDKGRADAP